MRSVIDNLFGCIRPTSDMGSHNQTFNMTMQKWLYLLTAIFSTIVICCLSFYLGAFSCGNYSTVLDSISITIVVLSLGAPIGRYFLARRHKVASPGFRQIGFFVVLVVANVLSHSIGWMFYFGFNWHEFVYGLDNVC